MLDVAYSALAELFLPANFIMLLVGVAVGIVIGILPAIGSTVGMSILLPFVYGRSPEQAIALLMGMGAITNSSASFTSILVGVPGNAGSIPTIVDGYPMAQRGEAGRALGAAFTASMLGGIFGAITLIAILPIARPIVLSLATPELFMMTLLGLAMIGLLVRGSALMGTLMGLLGLVLGTVGGAPAAPVYRYTFDWLYLMNGISLPIFAMGIFALPETVDLLAGHQSVSRSRSLTGDRWQGVKDVFRNKFLVLRCAVLGTFCTMIPGIGGPVADWMSYGLAKETVKGGHETFGKGDVRGVIAPESSANASEAGNLVPTLLFGIPGSGSMAIFLGALTVVGVQVGPSMLDPKGNLDLTLVIAWTLVLGNIIATATCFSLCGFMSRLSLISGDILMPFVLVIVFVATYEVTRQMGDLILLLIFGLLGWIMKRMRWPRPPLLIGFVLAGAAERYLIVASQRYGSGWLTRPGVLIIGSILVLTLLASVYRERRASSGRGASILDRVRKAVRQ
jgi:TctA family transporter